MRVTRAPAPDAMEAWGTVLAEIRRTGYYGQPQFEDSLTAAVVRQMGWKDLCISDDATADRARFVDAYQRQEQRARSQDVLPESLRDGALGYPLLQGGVTGEIIKRIAEARRVT